MFRKGRVRSQLRRHMFRRVRMWTLSQFFARSAFTRLLRFILLPWARLVVWLLQALRKRRPLPDLPRRLVLLRRAVLLRKQLPLCSRPTVLLRKQLPLSSMLSLRLVNL